MEATRWTCKDCPNTSLTHATARHDRQEPLPRPHWAHHPCLFLKGCRHSLCSYPQLCEPPGLAKKVYCNHFQPQCDNTTIPNETQHDNEHELHQTHPPSPPVRRPLDDYKIPHHVSPISPWHRHSIIHRGVRKDLNVALLIDEFLRTVIICISQLSSQKTKLLQCSSPSCYG